MTERINGYHLAQCISAQEIVLSLFKKVMFVFLTKDPLKSNRNYRLFILCVGVVHSVRDLTDTQ